MWIIYGRSVTNVKTHATIKPPQTTLPTTHVVLDGHEAYSLEHHLCPPFILFIAWMLILDTPLVRTETQREDGLSTALLEQRRQLCLDHIAKNRDLSSSNKETMEDRHVHHVSNLFSSYL